MNIVLVLFKAGKNLHLIPSNISAENSGSNNEPSCFSPEFLSRINQPVFSIIKITQITDQVIYINFQQNISFRCRLEIYAAQYYLFPAALGNFFLKVYRFENPTPVKKRIIQSFHSDAFSNNSYSYAETRSETATNHNRVLTIRHCAYRDVLNADIQEVLIISSSVITAG